MSSVRVLPLLILVGIAVLSVKVTGLFDAGQDQDAVSAPSVTMMQQAVAQDAVPPTGDDAPAGEPGLDDPAMSPALDQEDASAAQDAPVPNFGGDPTLFTQEEIDLLQNLSVRRAELTRKEQRLDERESLLAAAEARIDAKIEEMKTLQTAIEGLVETKEAQEDDRIKKLVSVYEKMKPKDAARIWNELDMEILLQVALGMREANTAAVLAEMTPDRARALTTELAYKQDINMLSLQ
ncbi:MotE family protein [Thalassospira sp.]|uniref:MotE family protein n=1 Tax=Thalassospira sp. TaxID=1912094 RepID=UPI002733BA05|nr:hypothetical protein [Thalassospira sp.]MDP2696675.1 hypothetical protein [Thalassospira sp.]